MRSGRRAGARRGRRPEAGQREARQAAEGVQVADPVQLAERVQPEECHRPERNPSAFIETFRRAFGATLGKFYADAGGGSVSQIIAESFEHLVFIGKDLPFHIFRLSE
jgi:hypothetical protein